jgi:adenosylcobinamide amidohydrolase
MADIIPLPQPHLVVATDAGVNVISIADIRALAHGTISIAEFTDPELFARALALIALDYLNDR